ncbi:MAG: TetR/AcrR family transcriptional regulator [Pseudomonadota bacterium]
MNRDRVLDAATKVARRDGIEGLSIASVAKVAGVTPMALYRHVSNREDLVQGIVNRAASNIEFPDDCADDPASEIEAVFCAFYDTLCREDWLVPHLISGQRGGEAALPLVVRALRAFEAIGLPRGQVWHACAPLVHYTYGEVLALSTQQRAARERAIQKPFETEAGNAIRDFAMNADRIDPRSCYQTTLRRYLKAIVDEVG